MPDASLDRVPNWLDISVSHTFYIDLRQLPNSSTENITEETKASSNNSQVRLCSKIDPEIFLNTAL